MASSLERLKASHGLTVTWHAYELRPAGSPPLPDWYKARVKAMRPQFEAMARAQYGVEIKSGPFGINSRPAMIGAKYAAAEGAGETYNRAMLRAYWQEGQDISDMAVMLGVAQAVGLDPDAYASALDNPDYEAQVDADIAQAAAYGLTGVPALIFADRYLVMGAQPYEELARIIDQIRARHAGTET